MIKLIEELCKTKNYVSLYTDIENPSKFCYGQFLAYDKNKFIFSMISPEGRYDGFLLRAITDIIKIDMDAQYDKRMQKLLSFNKDITSIAFPYTDDVTYTALCISKTTNKVVSIELNYSGTDDVIGYVDTVNDNICKIKQIDFYGCPDGTAYINIADISQISIDSSAEQVLWKLSNPL